jgi:hypothetical protein
MMKYSNPSEEKTLKKRSTTNGEMCLNSNTRLKKQGKRELAKNKF